jgi:hypothetical protein
VNDPPTPARECVSELDLVNLSIAAHEIVPQDDDKGYTSRKVLVDGWHAKAERLVRRHWPAVTALANELLDRREMTGAEVERFVRGRM